MPIIAPPNPETRKIVSLVTDLEQRMRRAEAGLRAAQLKNASITDGGLNIYDDNGVVRTVLGKQEDGSYTAISTNNPNPPPVPAAPQAIEALASIIVRHTGETQSGVGWPADLNHLNIYYADAQNPEDWKPGGSLGTGWPEELPIAPLEYTVYLVCVTAVNHSGKESAKSEVASASPRQVVSNDLIADITSNLELSAGQVTEAAIAAKAVTATKIADNAIETPMITAGAIRGFHIAADQIDSGKIIAQSITARELAALAVIAGKIDTNAVTAGTIAAGAVTAIKLESNLVIASRIIAGTLNGNRVELHPLLGLQAFTSGGTVRSFWLDASTGSGFFMGQVTTAGSGERIVMNPGGNNPNRIQLWASSNAFAYIDTFSEGASAAGITMQSSGGDTRKVGTVWLRQQYAQLGIADSGLVAGSQFYAEPNFVRSRSATVDLIVDQALTAVNGPRRVALINYNTGNAPVVNSSLYYVTATANQYPMLFSPPFGVGIIWDGGEYIAFVNGNISTYDRVPVEASLFRQVSDSRMKESVSDIEWSALDLIKRNPAKKWKRKQGPQRRSIPGDLSTPQRAVFNSDGSVKKTSEGDTVFQDVEHKKQEPWYFGPMADNMPPELVHIDTDSDVRKIDLGSMIGVLWKAISELNAEVQSLKDSNGK